MSRSKKKTPIHGMTTCVSEKKDKRLWHKRMRTHERDRLITDPDGVQTHKYAVSDPWTMGKDGKYYWHKHPDLMRK